MNESTYTTALTACLPTDSNSKPLPVAADLYDTNTVTHPSQDSGQRGPAPPFCRALTQLIPTPVPGPTPAFKVTVPWPTIARPPRVLLIAEACHPAWTSVPLVGYNFARALAARPDLQVTLVSQVRNRSALEADPIAAAVRLHFVDNEWLARPLYRLARLLRGGTALSWPVDTAMAWPSYMVFEEELFRHFRRPLNDGQFDIIHRVTPLTPTMGSPMARLVDVPMIVGPLNGGLPWPKEYPELRRQEREWLVPLRGLYKHLPYYRSTYRRLCRHLG